MYCIICVVQRINGQWTWPQSCQTVVSAFRQNSVDLKCFHKETSCLRRRFWWPIKEVRTALEDKKTWWGSWHDLEKIYERKHWKSWRGAKTRFLPRTRSRFDCEGHYWGTVQWKALGNSFKEKFGSIAACKWSKCRHRKWDDPGKGQQQQLNN